MAKSISGPQSCKVPLCDSGQRIVRGMCSRNFRKLALDYEDDDD